MCVCVCVCVCCVCVVCACVGAFMLYTLNFENNYVLVKNV